MKTLGLLGGMSWESTLPYYRLINETVRDRLGGLHSARLLLYNVDFAEVERLQHAGDWNAAGELLGRAACSLRDGGAQLLVICTNTMHKVAAQVEATSQLPLLHIADPTGAAIRAAGLSKIGLLGTRFTMEQDFYRQRLIERHGLDVLVPEADEREIVHRVIYDELCLGKIRDESRDHYRRIIGQLVARGAQGVILGCTEIGLLIGPQDVDVALFDTTALHARAAALACIGEAAAP
jgi:aspartate racemase